MRSSLHARALRPLAALALSLAALLPGVGPATAQETLVLRVGTTQDLDSINPFQTALVVGFEVFTLNYDLLVGFGPDLEPVPGYAASWDPSSDGLTWTFKMRPGMKWSDGTAATSEDARWTLQLVLDAVKNEESVALGYLDPYVKNAGITEVAAPDPETLVITTDRPNSQVLQMYVPILPKHVWGTQTLATIGDFTNDPPIVGSGPYQAVEWQTGQFVRFERNPNYGGTQGAADEVVIQFFKDSGTMIEALKNGELDYARGANPEQFDALAGQPDIVTVVGTANGFTEFGFNAYSKDIEGGGASTKALRDPAFRDALGYAIDKQLLLERVLGGYGEIGTTQVPPFQVKWHVEPTTPRTFDIELAKQKLDAAGYALDSSGNRLDKEGKALNLRLYMPDSDENYPKSAQFIQDWFAQLGIKTSAEVFDSGTLVDLELPPEAGENYKADFDLFIWGWVGDVDPNSLLNIFTCDQIGSSSDSLFCEERYDELFALQNEATSDAERKGYLVEMQNIVYDQAPYHILYYDANLDVYRTDLFTGWQNQPRSNGTPLFGYGPLGYTLLTDATAQPSPEPSAAPSPGSSEAPSAAPSPAPGPTGGTGDSTTLIVVVAVAVVAVVVIGYVLRSRRRSAAEEE